MRVMDSGFWQDFQPLTSEVDWCETNYATTSNIAEFWNTISNALFFVIPPILLYLFRQYACQVGYGVNLVWTLLIVVGLGSTMFHSTLSFVGQMLDELAILWVCTAALGSWLPSKYLPGSLASARWKYQAILFVFTILASVGAFIRPELNHVFLFIFVAPAICLLVHELQLCQCPRVYSVGTTAAAWWSIGSVCWVSDRFMCQLWIDVIHFPYLHSVWHVLVCLGAYMACVCFAYFYAVYEAPEKCPAMKFWPNDSHTRFGIPYVILENPTSKLTKSF